MVSYEIWREYCNKWVALKGTVKSGNKVLAGTVISAANTFEELLSEVKTKHDVTLRYITAQKQLGKQEFALYVEPYRQNRDTLLKQAGDKKYLITYASKYNELGSLVSAIYIGATNSEKICERMMDSCGNSIACLKITE